MSEIEDLSAALGGPWVKSGLKIKTQCRAKELSDELVSLEREIGNKIADIRSKYGLSDGELYLGVRVLVDPAAYFRLGCLFEQP